MMKKVSIHIDYETLDSIVVTGLVEAYETMKQSYKDRLDGTESVGIFSTHKEEDLRDIKRHLKAFKRVLKYYGHEDSDSE